MNFLEKNLEQIIFETPNEDLRSRGLNINGVKKKQQSIGNYGICDIVTCERDSIFNDIRINVYELKKDVIDITAFLQAVRYCKGIQSYLEKRGRDYFMGITLIGSKIDTSDFIYLPDLIHNINFNFKVYEYQYRFDGIYFNKVKGYKLINEGFNYGSVS